jgi:hypothetical protein
VPPVEDFAEFSFSRLDALPLSLCISLQHKLTGYREVSRAVIKARQEQREQNVRKSLEGAITGLVAIGKKRRAESKI